MLSHHTLDLDENAVSDYQAEALTALKVPHYIPRAFTLCKIPLAIVGHRQLQH